MLTASGWAERDSPFQNLIVSLGMGSHEASGSESLERRVSRPVCQEVDDVDDLLKGISINAVTSNTLVV